MDLHNYIYETVDNLGLNLNHKQRNYLEKLFLEQYSKGSETVHDVIKKSLFLSRAVPVLKNHLEEIKDDRCKLEDISLGDVETIFHLDNIVSEIQDRFFSKTMSYCPLSMLELLNLQGHTDLIKAKSFELYEQGIRDGLNDWCKQSLIEQADNFLKIEHPSPSPKTPTIKPLVESALRDLLK